VTHPVRSIADTNIGDRNPIDAAQSCRDERTHGSKEPVVMTRARARAATVASAFSLVGCGSAEEPQATQIELEFEARFGSERLDCNAPVSGLGSSKVEARPLDFRLFVHDVELVRRSGEHVALRLTDDGAWQRDGVALLDFEDGSGSCETGSTDTNVSLRGSAPPHDDYVGLAFTVGVPERLNHLDAATAPAPLNVPGMWWSWQGGYKYVRIDIASDDHPGGFFFHLGGTNCDGSPAEGFTCQYSNLARVELASNALGTVVVNAATLYRTLDLTEHPDPETDHVSGCMAFSGDPECPAMFGAFGLAFEMDGETASAQTAFAMQ
jgi:uncharacterized repeat protein (TIGR04052 family)